MNKSGDLKSLVLWMFNGALVSIWLYGAWHAYESHELSTAGLALVLPPYGLYLAMEAGFGHSTTTPEAQAAANAEQFLDTVSAWCYRQPMTARLNEAQRDVYCACVSEMFAEDFPADLSLDPNSDQHNQSRINARIHRVGGSCMSSVVYLGRGPEPEKSPPTN
jgi:hypothetical protein